MPNKRKASKQHVSGYFERELIARLDALAKTLAVRRTELLRESIERRIADESQR